MKNWLHRLWGSVQTSPGKADSFLIPKGVDVQIGAEKAPTGGPGKPWYKQAAAWLKERDLGVMPVEQAVAVTGDHGAVETSDEELIEYFPHVTGMTLGSDDPLAERRARVEELLKELEA